MLIAVSLVVLPAVILAGAWRLGGVSALEDDLLYYLPIRQYIGQRVRAGEWPLWNPLVSMGTSLAADPQAGLWYPPTVLFVILPPLIAYPVTIILHFALAGWGMYRFLRALRRDWQVAFLGAVAFEFCGYLVAHRAHLTIFEAAAWVPWILYGWQRFADSGKYRHFLLASLAFGLQMLVQHTQVSIMTVAIVTAYVVFVLLPSAWRLAWQYPLGMVAGAGLAAVQTVPTLLSLAGSGRATPTYATFIENSWVPSSALMMLFPMLFGNRTPTFWGQPWWGISHFCEQSAYGSIAILVLATASISLVRRPRMINQPEAQARVSSRPTLACASGWLAERSSREVLFWWGASLIVLVVALGDLTPVSKWLFHVPVYRNLRVPARWILVWSLAMPVLASAVLTAIRRGGPAGERATAAIRIVGTRVLPVAAGGGILLIVIARLLANRLETAYGNNWGAKAILDGLRSAVRPGNPAIIWPLVLMAASVAALLWWTRRRDGRAFAAVFGLMLLDLASVAAFVDVDSTTYTRDQLVNPPPLAQFIKQRHPDPGHRLLVPRYQADYRSPLAVLWPETNMRWGVPTFNAYGPFWPRANRLLFRFMPWGSSEGMLELLRNRRLCAAMGVRFIAARTPEELAIVQAAMAPAVNDELQRIAGFDQWTPVRYGQDLRWPVRIDRPGFYQLRFEAEPVAGSPSQWFVRLETPAANGIGWTRRLEPVDLSGGRRSVEFLFECPEAVGSAFARIKSEIGHGLSVRSPTFRRVAELPSASATVLAAASASQPSDQPGLTLLTITADGVHVYELASAAPLVRFADAPLPVKDAGQAIEILRDPSTRPWNTVYEVGEAASPALADVRGRDRVTYERPAGDVVRVTAYCDLQRLLVLNESYDSGWRATVDGQPTPILRVNAVVQGAMLPGGREHRVEWHYRPPGLVAGGLVSLGVIIALAGGAARNLAKRRPPQAAG